MIRNDDENGRMNSARRLHDVKRVLWVVLSLNILVAVAKFIYGTLTTTTSMQADGIHSLFDSTGNIVGLIGMSMASRPADYEHPYGHAKFETYASVIIGLMLLLAAYSVGRTAVIDLTSGSPSPHVTGLSFFIMIGTLCINLFVTTWERTSAKRLKSEILAADSQHTFSDVLVTMGVLTGLIFIKLGYTIVDPIMSLVVACAILYTAWEVFRQANTTLSDHARIPPDEIACRVDAIAGVRDCHGIRTRGSESEVYMDIHILVDPDMSVQHAHELADRAEETVKEHFPTVKEVMVHVEPDTEQEREEGSADPHP